ncbi:MAG: polyprenyl synthetase family protein [Nitrosomonas sp.]|nr:polyprenyl synthetase family protein [Nitrosomonas sp.]
MYFISKEEVSFDALIEKANQDTFCALEKLLPRKKRNFLQNICSTKDCAINECIKIDERAYNALSIPLWEILKRKGKGWRGYILQVSCEAIGNQFDEYLDWLALPEIMHVGSLIIDDVQDSSEIRRGGKACHLIYGTGAAINAGTFAYFIGQKLIENSVLEDQRKLALYQEYMSLLLNAHIGQGLDIEGLKLVLEDSGSSTDTVFNTVMDIHKRKSGIPFGSFARMGAILGCGSAEQIKVLGDFFEEIGTLFQVRDDIINITGFDSNLKLQFEDLDHGKITLPVAVALRNLTKGKKELLSHLLRSSNHDAETLKNKLLSAIESTNSVKYCEDLIERSYKSALEVLLNSRCKLVNTEKIQMFSKRMLDFHY